MARKQSKAISKKKILNQQVAVEVYENPDNGYDTLITPDLIERVEKLYHAGVQDVAIANSIGINILTFRGWLIKGMSFNRGIHGELFRRCAKAVGNSEIQFFLELRKHGFGSEAEFFTEPATEPARDNEGRILLKENGEPYMVTIKDEEGKIVMRIARDKDGAALVKRQAIRGNPIWLSWIMERRFKKNWARQDKFDLSENLPDQGIFDAPLPKTGSSDDEKTVNDLSSTNDGDLLKVFEAAAKAQRMKVESKN